MWLSFWRSDWWGVLRVGPGRAAGDGFCFGLFVPWPSCRPCWSRSRGCMECRGCWSLLGWRRASFRSLIVTPGPFRRLVGLSLPLLVAGIVITPASAWVADQWQAIASGRTSLAAAGLSQCPFRRVGHRCRRSSGLNGYARPTSTTLVELAERGVRFDRAISASSWTLPSHATMFTGKWLHDLSVGWLTPLDSTDPTVAEFSARAGSQRPVLLPTTLIVLAIQGWHEVLPIMRTLSSRN